MRISASTLLSAILFGVGFTAVSAACTAEPVTDAICQQTVMGTQCCDSAEDLQNTGVALPKTGLCLATNCKPRGTESCPPGKAQVCCQGNLTNGLEYTTCVPIKG
ncbi:hypothetical protein BDQ12DRAFT_724348 [Crucibulum laeve]|uniref:Hydrophobin n=1 Tax=Crucibulum laeve TaxID=68775 RepID=A0A5C3LWK1_9AGAR|nr:hypothetical protein BDQ12DRAFT_724348 [Crucibulum laeve]